MPDNKPVINHDHKPEGIADLSPSARELKKQIVRKAQRKLSSRKYPAAGVWFGLGMMGLIGWSIVVPTLLGAGIGIWADKHYPGAHSWTLALLMGGLTLGCINAWRWIDSETSDLCDEPEPEDDPHDGQ